MSLFGDIRLSRTYYYCSQCGASQQPWDQRLGLTQRRVTPATAELASLAGTLSSFGLAAERTLVRMSGIRLSESSVQRVTEDTGVPQQAAGGGKAEGRMAAVAMVFNARSEFEEQPPKDPHQVRYLAGIHDLDELGLEWRKQAAQVGWDEAEQQIALTDGAPCLENFMAKNAPLAVRILDFYHASEHVAELARSVCLGDEEAFTKLQHTWCHQLKHEGGTALLIAWEALDKSHWNETQRECYRQQEQYLRNNVSRMDYPAYLAHGWMIGSGPVEAACKLVIAQRLKGTGMRWREPGSDAICHLRALFLSQPGQWEAFWYHDAA